MMKGFIYFNYSLINPKQIFHSSSYFFHSDFNRRPQFFACQKSLTKQHFPLHF